MRMMNSLIAVILLGAVARGASLQIVRPAGGDPAPSPNPPVVELLITDAVVNDEAFRIAVDGREAVLLPAADGVDNDADGMIDEQGEALVSWPSPSTSRFMARWPWAVAEDDPSTAANEGIHDLHVAVRLDGQTLEGHVRFAVFATGGVDSVLVFPSPFDPWRTVARIAYRLRTAGSLRIRVHDFQGRPVATVRDWSIAEPGWFFPGERWDGRDDQGRRVANGVYFVRVEFDNGRWISETVESCLVAH